MRNLSNLEVQYVGGGGDDPALPEVKVEAEKTGFWESLWNGIVDFFTPDAPVPEDGCTFLLMGQGICDAGADALRYEQERLEYLDCMINPPDGTICTPPTGQPRETSK